MRLKNTSLVREAYISQLNNLKVPPNSIINVPSQYTFEQVVEAICPFKATIELLEGFIVTRYDVDNAETAGQAGIMSKEVYDKNLNNIVDDAEHAITGGSGTSIEFIFDYMTFSSTLVTLGTALAGNKVEDVKVDVQVDFDDGTVSVGDAGNLQRLMRTDENDLRYPNVYSSSSTYSYSVQTNIIAQFSGNPTIGNGKIIVYLS